MKNFINKLLGDQNKKVISKIKPVVDKINQIEEDFQKVITTKEQVQAKTEEFKKRLEDGENLDDLLPEAYALVKTACRHIENESWDVRGKPQKWGMIPYDVQLIGAIVLHQGNIAEMKTGEGKTLVSTMPIYLNALSGKGVYAITVNSYLAQRDAEWVGGLFKYLGLTVGVAATGMSHQEKKDAYNCDITYGTNNEFGFDYLRDNMATDTDRVVQRELNYAIIDEVDSVLIDEARTPLIISAPAEESTTKYLQYAKIIPQLKENTHYDIDEKGKSAALTEEGISKMEQMLGIDNIYTEAGFAEVHHIEQALRAHTCFKVDVDYIVKEGQIIIIDQFTGRLMAGRRYSQGLHQAIEAKEGVEIKRESKTLATITFQNYFRMFNKLSGMTGTAVTEQEEFYQIYGLDTIVIPTNKPIARIDQPDSVFKNQKGKYLASARKIKELHEKGQPVLVGTISVEKSELISKLLKMEGVPHNVLNAKNHQKEAEIVENAGQRGAVTIATNMAGRGTDIKLGEGIKELGGLFVLGTERHESRRIDNQLRGRSGRQGDVGESQFFVSMEDDLMRLFGGDRMKGIMDRMNFPEDQPIENGLISRSIESAQKKVEGRNFDIRKHLVEYDDVMNIHREVVYKRRQDFLNQEDCSKVIQEMVDEELELTVINHANNFEEMAEALHAIHPDAPSKSDLESTKDQNELLEFVKDAFHQIYKKRTENMPEPEEMHKIERAIFLRANDTLWTNHITTLKTLRENVAFSGYAQKNPLIEYKSQGYDMFQKLLASIRTSTVHTLFKIDLARVVLGQMLRRAAAEKAKTNNKEEKETVTRSTLDTEDTSKVGRNDPCPCGSGKKFKKCHGAE